MFVGEGGVYIIYRRVFREDLSAFCSCTGIY